MKVNVKGLFILTGLLLSYSSAPAVEGVNVVYPGWFKNSFYDLQGDLQDAKSAGKSGIMVFFSTKTCSYCKAIIETSLQQTDIVKRLRANYDVIGLEVLSDTEVVNTKGKSLWAKDFAVQEKAKFTPTMIFYNTRGEKQLRLIGYQSPKKFRAALNYLEGKHYTRMKLREYLRQHKPTSLAKQHKKSAINLDRRKASKMPLLVVFESANCKKCQQLRTMLKAQGLQRDTKNFNIVHVSSADMMSQITTPEGKKISGREWANQLGLIHSPAMLFFNERGKEVLRVDTDILINEYGKAVSVNDADVLNNIRGRLQFVLQKGYIALPQYQRWRAQQSRNK